MTRSLERLWAARFAPIDDADTSWLIVQPHAVDDDDFDDNDFDDDYADEDYDYDDDVDDFDEDYDDEYEDEDYAFEARFQHVVEAKDPALAFFASGSIPWLGPAGLASLPRSAPVG